MKQLHSFAFCIYQVIAITTGLKLQTSYFMLIFILLGPVSFYFLQKLPSPIEEEPATEAKEGTISLESSSEDSWYISYMKTKYINIICYLSILSASVLEYLFNNPLHFFVPEVPLLDQGLTVLENVLPWGFLDWKNGWAKLA